MLEPRERIGAGFRMSRIARAVDALMAQEIVCQRRHQRARQHIGRRQRQHHRFSERPEQIAGDAAEPEHRHESDADAQ